MDVIAFREQWDRNFKDPTTGPQWMIDVLKYTYQGSPMRSQQFYMTDGPHVMMGQQIYRSDASSIMKSQDLPMPYTTSPMKGQEGYLSSIKSPMRGQQWGSASYPPIFNALARVIIAGRSK